MKKRILCLFYRQPERKGLQNSYGQYYILKALSEIFDTKYLCLAEKKDDDDKCVIRLSPNSGRKILNFITHFQSPRLTHYWSSELFQKYKNELQIFKPDLVYVEHILMMQYVLKNPPDCKIIFFDDESMFFIKKNNLLNSSYQKMRNINLAEMEKKACKISDVILTITGDERDYLRSIGFNNTFHLPYGVDTEYFTYKWNPPQDEFRILFVGNFSHYPNREAAKLIYKKIYPEVKHLRNIKFIIVGRNTNLIKKYLNKEISVYDNVSDVRQYYWDSSVFIAPIFSGGGLRIKMLEGASSGIPIIATPVANFGIHLENLREAFIVNNIEEMVKSIIALSKKGSVQTAHMSRNAREKIIEKFSLSKISELIENTFLNI